jgi:hypothetical protein
MVCICTPVFINHRHGQARNGQLEVALDHGLLLVLAGLCCIMDHLPCEPLFGPLNDPSKAPKADLDQCTVEQGHLTAAGPKK